MKITSHPGICIFCIFMFSFESHPKINSKLIFFSINSDGEQRNLEEHIQSFGESLHRDHHKHQYLDYNHDHHYLDSRYRHIQYIQSFGESLHHYHHYDHHDHHYLDYKHIEITSIFRALVSLFTNGESPLSPLWLSRLTNKNPIPWKPASLKMAKSGVTKIWLFLHSIAHVMVWSLLKWKHIACYVDSVMSQLDITHNICYIILKVAS